MFPEWVCRDGTKNHLINLATQTCDLCGLTASQIVKSNHKVQSKRGFTESEYQRDFGPNADIAKRYYENQGRTQNSPESLLSNLLKEKYYD